MPHLKTLLIAIVLSALLAARVTAACPEDEKKKCTAGKRDSCEAVAACYEEQKLRSEARPYYERACDLGSWVACEMVGDQLTQPEDDRNVTNCQEYLAAKKDGFALSDSSTAGQAEESFFKHQCAVLDYLAHAKPSKQSFLADYRFGPDSLADFPPCTDVSASGIPDEATTSGTSCRVFNPKMKITALRPHGFTATDGADEVILDFKAWGDVNGDGIEDVLANVGTYAVGGTFRIYSNITFTRRDGEKLFRVVDAAGDRACPDTTALTFACPWDLFAKERSAFQSLFDAKRYDEAYASLTRTRQKCFATLSREKKLWLLSDMSLAALKAGKRKECLALLNETTDVCGNAYNCPGDEALGRALAHNRASCSGT